MEKVNVYKLADGKRVKTDKIYIRNASWGEGEELLLRKTTLGNGALQTD